MKQTINIDIDQIKKSLEAIDDLIDYENRQPFPMIRFHVRMMQEEIDKAKQIPPKIKRQETPSTGQFQYARSFNGNADPADK